LRIPELVECTHLLRRSPPAMQPPRSAPRTLLEERERTPQRLARILLQPPLHWVHPHPRSSPRISCRVHNRLSTKYDYQTKCTTEERSSLTSSTGLLSRLGRQGCWRCRPVQPQQVPPLGPQSPLALQQQPRPVQCSPQGAGASATPQVLLRWGLGCG
jgi:hypothetical protein